MKARKYYTLAGIFQDNQYEILFGDYDLEVVKQEKIDNRDLVSDFSAKKLTIITTSDGQGEIDWAISVLNAKQSLKDTDLRSFTRGAEYL
jgi:hypothetical protein